MFLTLGCILRDEGKYIADWLTFHSMVGFDRFICVLHKCVDNTEEQINIAQKNLGLDIYIHHCTSDGQVQMGTYQWIHKEYGHYTEWLLFLDGDEYVYDVNPTRDYRNDLKKRLKSFPETVSSVSFHGKVFGPSEHTTPPDYRLSAYIERLPLHLINSNVIKSFVRPDKVTKLLTPHYQQVEGSAVRFDGKPFTVRDGVYSENLPVHVPVCYNHYYTGSMEDWVKRTKRGSCNDLRPGTAYSIREFVFHTQYVEHDTAILKYQQWHRVLLQRALSQQFVKFEDATPDNTIIIVNATGNIISHLKEQQKNGKKYAIITGSDDTGLLDAFNRTYDGGVLFCKNYFGQHKMISPILLWHISAHYGKNSFIDARYFGGLISDIIKIFWQVSDVREQLISKNYHQLCTQLFANSGAQVDATEIDDDLLLQIMQCEPNPLIKLDTFRQVFNPSDTVTNREFTALQIPCFQL